MIQKIIEDNFIKSYFNDIESIIKNYTPAEFKMSGVSGTVFLNVFGNTVFILKDLAKEGDPIFIFYRGHESAFLGNMTFTNCQTGVSMSTFSTPLFQKQNLKYSYTSTITEVSNSSTTKVSVRTNSGEFELDNEHFIDCLNQISNEKHTAFYNHLFPTEKLKADVNQKYLFKSYVYMFLTGDCSVINIHERNPERKFFKKKYKTKIKGCLLRRVLTYIKNVTSKRKSIFEYNSKKLIENMFLNLFKIGFRPDHKSPKKGLEICFKKMSHDMEYFQDLLLPKLFLSVRYNKDEWDMFLLILKNDFIILFEEYCFDISNVVMNHLNKDMNMLNADYFDYVKEYLLKRLNEKVESGSFLSDDFVLNSKSNINKLVTESDFETYQTFKERVQEKCLIKEERHSYSIRI